MNNNSIALLFMLAAFAIMSVHSLVLMRRLKHAEIRAVIAEVELRHHKEQAAFENARDITKR